MIGVNTEKVVRLSLECLHDDGCVVAFEPEGAVHKLPRGEEYVVLIQGAGSGEVGVSYDGDGLTIWAWEGASTAVTDGAGRTIPT